MPKIVMALDQGTTSSRTILFDENGKIVEHWDSMQEIPEESAHKNTMY